LASNAWKWVAGCGAGCVVVVLIVAGLSVGGFFFVKDAVQDVVQEVEQAEQAQRQMRERHGSASEFAPWTDGAIPAERIEAFLAVREQMAPLRGEIEETLSTLAGGENERGGAMKKVRAGVELVPRLIGFYTGRTTALLEGGMGSGEYLYLYVLAYYTWLGNSPADGPPFQLVGDDERERGWRTEFGEPEEAEVREQRLERVLPELNRLTLSMLRNQLTALDAAADSEGDEGWRAALEAEIRALEADPDRLPWQDGLPPATEESLEPFRERLLASYSELVNVLDATVEGF
jgi:hypothetical protein